MTVSRYNPGVHPQFGYIFPLQIPSSLALRVETCASDECEIDEECGDGCGCILESLPMRCGPLELIPSPNPCHADIDRGVGCESSTTADLALPSTFTTYLVDLVGSSVDAL